MSSAGYIEHDGIVQSSDNQSVTIKITSASACSGCHAGKYCNISQTEEKIINVPGSYNVAQGDNVTVLMKETMGYSAVFLGYLFPLILVVTMLIILTSLQIPELVAGAVSAAILLPYYLILIILKKQINQKFTFTIKT